MIVGKACERFRRIQIKLNQCASLSQFFIHYDIVRIFDLVVAFHQMLEVEGFIVCEREGLLVQFFLDIGWDCQM